MREWILITSLGGVGTKEVDVRCTGRFSLKVRGRGWQFCYLIFSRFIIFTFRDYFTLCKTVLYIWRKIILFCQHSFMKKIHFKLSKKEPASMCKEGGSLRESGRVVWNILKGVGIEEGSGREWKWKQRGKWKQKSLKGRGGASWFKEWVL